MLEAEDFSIKKANLYETVAERLEQLILDDTLKLGEKLPSEQALADKFGVSRNIVREAFKILKERGLIEVHSGEGAFIAKPRSKMLHDMINRVIVMGDVTLSDVYEARYALEVAAVACAAERSSEEDVDELKQIVENMKSAAENADKWIELDWEFHSKIAKISKNQLFSYFIKSLTGSMMTIFLQGYESSPQSIEAGILDHIAITNAIVEKNPELAKKAMFEHLKHSEKDVLSIK